METTNDVIIRLARRSTVIDELKIRAKSVEEYASLVKEQLEIKEQISELRKRNEAGYTKARRF